MGIPGVELGRRVTPSLHQRSNHVRHVHGAIRHPVVSMSALRWQCSQQCHCVSSADMRPQLLGGLAVVP